MAQASPSKLMEETTLKENKPRTQEPHGICFLAEVERQKVTEVSVSSGGSDASGPSQNFMVQAVWSPQEVQNLRMVSS